MLILDDEYPQAMPSKVPAVENDTLDMPTDNPALRQVLQDNAMIFILGKTTVTEHVIETGEASTVKVPVHPIPFHYLERVHNQLQEIAQEGIIRRSNSPWCAQLFMCQKAMVKFEYALTLCNLTKLLKKMFIQYPELRVPN